jgi:hypothetical protein
MMVERHLCAAKTRRDLFEARLGSRGPILQQVWRPTPGVSCLRKF